MTYPLTFWRRNIQSNDTHKHTHTHTHTHTVGGGGGGGGGGGELRQINVFSCFLIELF